MFEHDLVCGEDWLASLSETSAAVRPDLPHRVVRGLIQQADLLVARETGERQRRNWLRRQVQRLVADELV